MSDQDQSQESQKELPSHPLAGKSSAEIEMFWKAKNALASKAVDDAIARGTTSFVAGLQLLRNIIQMCQDELEQYRRLESHVQLENLTPEISADIFGKLRDLRQRQHDTQAAAIAAAQQEKK